MDAEKTSSEKGRNIKNSPWGATHLKGTRSMGFSEGTKSVLTVTSSPGTEPGPLKHSWSNSAGDSCTYAENRASKKGGDVEGAKKSLQNSAGH